MRLLKIALILLTLGILLGGVLLLLGGALGAGVALARLAAVSPTI